MQIVINDSLKDAMEMTCECASKYNVDISINMAENDGIYVNISPAYWNKVEEQEGVTE